MGLKPSLDSRNTHRHHSDWTPSVPLGSTTCRDSFLFDKEKGEMTIVTGAEETISVSSLRGSLPRATHGPSPHSAAWLLGEPALMCSGFISLCLGEMSSGDVPRILTPFRCVPHFPSHPMRLLLIALESVFSVFTWLFLHHDSYAF